jgi:hypothetical protein
MIDQWLKKAPATDLEPTSMAVRCDPNGEMEFLLEQP